MKVFLSWLGKTDIDNMLQDKSASISTLTTKHPVSFDEILILANSWEEHWHSFETWLSRRLALAGRPASVQVVYQSLESPTDYQAVAAIMQRNLEKITKLDNQVYINLTSGTPAMTAVSVLLGKGIYNCHLLQSGPNHTVEDVYIPFDFAATYARVIRNNVSAQVLAGPKPIDAFSGLFAESAAMQIAVAQAKRLAQTELPAVLLGETGTGKEVMARAIHSASSRSSKALRIINCGALPEQLVDSILFGHVKGAFTGADRDYAGLFEQADGGTLFLDEIGELPLSVQVKLLRALQQGEITRVGDSKTRQVDVRIIAATHRPLPKMVAEGSFREDLFYRLAVGIIQLPPLSQRLEDIPKLVQQVMLEINQNFAKLPNYQCKTICSSAIDFIKTQSWPGNIRALWNCLNRAVLNSEAAELSVSDIQNAMLLVEKPGDNMQYVPSLTANFDIQQHLDDIKEKLIYAALEKSAGNLSGAARLLGLANHQTLSNWIKKLDIEV